jgi:hypothetical protein
MVTVWKSPCKARNGGQWSLPYTVKQGSFEVEAGKVEELEGGGNKWGG